MAAAVAALAFAEKSNSSVARPTSRHVWGEADDFASIDIHQPSVQSNKKDAISSCMLCSDDLHAMCGAMIASGARDGVTGEAELKIDGMPLSLSVNIFEEILRLAAETEI